MASLVFSPRVRPTPFTKGVEAAGAKAFTVYNHMRLPSVFGTLEEDAEHLKTHVQVWDVSVERQVQIILKHKTEWPAFLESLCTSYGFSKKTCPIVFTSEGELIGDATAFLAWAKQKFSKDFRITNEMKKKRA